jgi:hypothetical protein
MNAVQAKRDEVDEVVAERRERTASARWALAGLSLSMLLSALGTSIANVGLPTLAQAFGASFGRFSGSSSPTFSPSPP